jgi:hypothetical protein
MRLEKAGSDAFTQRRFPTSLHSPRSNEEGLSGHRALTRSSPTEIRWLAYLALSGKRTFGEETP